MVGISFILIAWISGSTKAKVIVTAPICKEVFADVQVGGPAAPNAVTTVIVAGGGATAKATMWAASIPWF